VVLQLFAGHAVAALLDLIVEQNKTLGVVAKRSPDGHQRVRRHIDPGIGIGEHSKRIDVVQRFLIDPDGAIGMPGERHRKWRPFPGNLVLVDGQGVMDVGPDAVDVDVQLILAAAKG